MKCYHVLASLLLSDGQEWGWVKRWLQIPSSPCQGTGGLCQQQQMSRVRGRFVRVPLCAVPPGTGGLRVLCPGEMGLPQGPAEQSAKGNGSELTGAVIVWRCKMKGCLQGF